MKTRIQQLQDTGSDKFIHDFQVTALMDYREDIYCTMGKLLDIASIKLTDKRKAGNLPLSMDKGN